jgi:hypothetical protein
VFIALDRTPAYACIFEPLTQMPVFADILAVYRLFCDQADALACLLVELLKLARCAADVDLDTKLVPECLHIGESPSFLFDGLKESVFNVKSHQMLV